MNFIKMLKQACIVGALVSSVSASAAVGTITTLLFAGPNDPNHPNVVQFAITGGVNGGVGPCNGQITAVRNTPENQHIISMLLTAYAMNQTIDILQDQSDFYFGDRCTISRASMSK